jgi:hypothetical protein
MLIADPVFNGIASLKEQSFPRGWKKYSSL